MDIDDKKCHLEEQQVSAKETLQEITKDTNNLKSKVDLLSNLIIHQHDASQNMNKKIDDIQLCSMKPNLIISGLETSAKLETEVDCMELCVHFFQTIMEIQEPPIPMIMAHRTGPQSKDCTKARVERLQNP